MEFSERFASSTTTTPLKNVLAISTKSLNPQQHMSEIWEHYSIPAFDESHWPVFESANEIKSNKYIVDRNSILVSKLNPSIKRVWVPTCLTDKAVCSTEFIVYKPLEPQYKSFYCAVINSKKFTSYLLEHVTGSTGSRQRTQPKATLDFPMPNPDQAEIEAFCDFANPIYQQIQTKEIESQRLSSLRNALLPKLMSGEIDVSKVESFMPPNNHLSLLMTWNILKTAAMLTDWLAVVLSTRCCGCDSVLGMLELRSTEFRFHRSGVNIIVEFRMWRNP